VDDLVQGKELGRAQGGKRRGGESGPCREAGLHSEERKGEGVGPAGLCRAVIEKEKEKAS
jgi:hypothetical protein